MGHGKLPDMTILHELYWDDGLSLADIGDRYGVTRVWVHQVMKEMGIPRRDKSAARLLALERGKFDDHDLHRFNRNLFDTWSSGMAYLLGLIFADGHVHRGILSFGFGMRSEDIANNVIAIMESNREAIVTDNHGFPSLPLRYSSVAMSERLRDLGIPWGTKSISMQFPYVPYEHLADFLRGYWDGDGSATGKQVKFLSSSKPFLVGISSALEEHDSSISQGSLYTSPPRLQKFPQGTEGWCKEHHSLVYCSESDRQIIYSIFYGTAKDGEFSPRKHRMFERNL
jgi:hypothetical protein